MLGKKPLQRYNINAESAFIDLFAGCGGLSLGLMRAGWEGLFAIEQTPDAFKTLRHNLIDEGKHNVGEPRFNWPVWFEHEPSEIKNFVLTKRRYLRQLRGRVQLVAGGPPCQGFSFAGRRTGKDPRNDLFRYHLEVVDLLRPELVLMENVQGVDIAFGNGNKQKKKRRGRPRKSYADRIREGLQEHGYVVQQGNVKAVDYGVPQLRPRYFTIGIRKDLNTEVTLDFFSHLESSRRAFLKRYALPVKRPVTVSEAISDLLITGKEVVECLDEESPAGFEEIVYQGPKTLYQKLMHGNMNGNPLNSLRLVNHRPKTVQRFQEILDTCRKGVQLSDADRERLALRKTAIVPLAPDKPSHTLTTLPDDLLHYSEPRIHTVREHARLQSFPDWFEFRGKYTTGGDRRARECPRYTQVGNAVPPLLAEAIGGVLKELLASTTCSCRNSKTVKRL